MLYDLGEAMFAYIDAISAESAAGFAEAQSEAAGESQRRRRRLLQLLVQEPAASADAVRTAAQAAGWALPRRLAAVVAGEADQPEGLAAARGEAGPSEDLVDGIAARLARRLGPGAVGAAVGGLAVVMMPDPEGPGRRKALEAVLEGVAAVGPAVPWPEAAASLRRAQAAYRLAAAGGLGGVRRGGGTAGQAGASPRGQASASTGVQSAGRLVVADEHLPALLLAAAPAIAADLARTRLAPLDALAAGPRERLESTLRAWLDRPGQVQAIADALERPPADRPLPAQAAARAVRRAPGGSGRALRARARPSRRRRRSLLMWPCAFSSRGPRACSARMSWPPAPDMTSSPSPAPTSTSPTPMRCAPPCATRDRTRSSTARRGRTSTAPRPPRPRRR